MADRLLAALVIFAVLVVLGSAAAWALAAYTRRLDGKGSASQTPSQPGQVKVSIVVHDEMSQAIANALASVPSVSVSAGPWPPAPARADLCGAQGPGGMRCDQPPHDGVRHAEGDLTWTDPGGPMLRPAHLGSPPVPQPPTRGGTP